MRLPSRTLTILTLGTLGATSISIAAAPVVNAQSSSSSLSSLSSQPEESDDHFPLIKTPGDPVVMPGKYTVQIMRDLLGPGISDLVGFQSGDLGIMAPLKNDEFALIFGDSFRKQGLQGEWMSPVGVVAKRVDGVINILRPINKGDRVEQLISYPRPEGSNLTLIPSDVINLDGTLYLQGMWNRGIGNVDGTEIWKSTDSGKTWSSMGKEKTRGMNGLGDLISWEKGPDGYIYAVTSSFKRADPVYLWRFRPADIGDRSEWQSFNPATQTWSDNGAKNETAFSSLSSIGSSMLGGADSAEPILDKHVQAGEMSLRYIDGHWVLVMFNVATLQIEVRVSPDLARDWNDVPVAVVAKHGPWFKDQSPSNFSQPYGGYIVPGSSLDNMDIVVSQWNTSDNSRYNATQFNVRGLDDFFETNPATNANADVIGVTQREATRTNDQEVEDNLVNQHKATP